MSDANLRVTAEVAEAWNRANLNYAVVHGAEDYPNRMGRDLDVLANRGEVRRLLEIARATLERAGYKVRFPPRLWGPRLVACRDGSWSDTLEIHAITAVSWRNAVLADRPAVSGHNGPFALDHWALFAKRVLLPLVSQGAGRLAAELQKRPLAPAELAAARATLPARLGPELAEALIAAMVGGQAESFEPRVGDLRKTLLGRGWLHSPARSVRLLSNSFFRRLKQFYSPCAPVVALVGPDGAGKSSVLNELTGGDQSVFTDIVVRHWRPGLLPNLGRLAGRKPDFGPKGSFSPPRRHPGRFQPLRLAYYFTDFLLGYYWRDRVSSSRQALVLYDRCALDMAVDPVRYGLSSARGLPLLWRLLPKPDLVILLWDTPERIHARKAELEVAEIRRQLELWQHWASRGQVHRQVLVDAPPPVIAERIRKLILQAFIP